MHAGESAGGSEAALCLFERSEGEASGLAKGASQKQREIAKRMLQENIEKSVITKVTGLSLEEIEKL